jgi:hypothetical protein
VDRSVVQSATNTKLEKSSQIFGMPDLRRVAIWGVAAAGSLTAVAFASTSATGIDRLLHAAGQLQEVVRPTGNKSVRPLDAREGQRLADSVRFLAEERDRLQARISTIERSVESLTGSVARIAKVAEAAGAAAETAAAERPPPALAAIPADAPAAEEATASVSAAAAIAAAAPIQESIASSEPASKPEFGLDIGGAGTIEALRGLWAKARQQHATALEGLRALVHVRDSKRPGGVELRLVAGPLPSAVAAARICAKLNTAGTACRPAVFDGQRLAAR